MATWSHLDPAELGTLRQALEVLPSPRMCWEQVVPHRPGVGPDRIPVAGFLGGTPRWQEYLLFDRVLKQSDFALLWRALDSELPAGIRREVTA